MRASPFFLLLPYVFSLQSDVPLEDSIEEQTKVNLIVDISMNRFVEGLSDLTDSFNNKYTGDVSVDHSIDGSGIRVVVDDHDSNPLMFTHYTLSSAKLLIHHGHLHLAVNDFSGLFHGSPEFRSVLHQRFVPWSRSVRVNALIGPIHIRETSGFPYVNQHLHCKVEEIEASEEETVEGEEEIDRIVGRILSDKMKLMARTDHLVCTTLIQAFDSIIRQRIQQLKLSMVLPSDSLLIYSLIDNPTWLNTSASSSNLLRCRFHSRIRHLHQRDLPLPRMDPLLRVGSLRPLGPHQMGGLHSPSLLPSGIPLPQMDPHHSLPSDSQMDSLLPSDHSRSVLQPFDVYYHIFDSAFTQSLVHLCEKGRFDKEFTVPRGDFNISLTLKCEGKPRVDISDLHDSWKMKVGLPLLYTYRNDSSTTSQLIEKILTLSIHVTQLRLSFIAQSAFPQPNELGRFIFSNQIFRHLSHAISTYYTLPLPFLGSVRSSLPFVSAVDNRLVLALNLTRDI